MYSRPSTNLLTGRTRALPLVQMAAVAGAIIIGLVSAVLPATLTVTAIGAAVLIAAFAVTPYAALTILLVCAPLRALIDVRSPGLLPLDAGQIGLALLAGVWISHRAAGRRSVLNFRMSPALLAVSGFVAAGALSGLSAVNSGLWLNEWLKWLFALALLAWISSAGNWEWVLFALALAGIANALVGIWIYFGGSGASHFLIDQSHYRAFGTFEQPNPFGGFMGMLSPVFGAVCVGYAKVAWQGLKRKEAVPKRSRGTPGTPSSAHGREQFQSVVQAGFYFFAFVLTAAALVMSWSRGAWLAFGVAAVVAFVCLPRRARVSLALILVIAVAAFGAIASGRLPASITERIGSAFDDLVNVSDVRGATVTPENYAVVERLAHWQAAVEMARLQPFTGIGLGNYEAAYPQVRLMSWPFALGHAHNYYLNVLAETGMIGLAAYGAMWLVLAALTWRARRHPDPVASAAAAGLLGAWTYIAVHSITDQLYVNYAFLHVGVMMGIAALLFAHTWKPNRLKLQ